MLLWVCVCMHVCETLIKCFYWLTLLFTLVLLCKPEQFNVKGEARSVCVCMCVVNESASLLMQVLTSSHSVWGIEVHLKEWDGQDPCAGMCEVRAYLTDTHMAEDKCISSHKQLNATNAAKVMRGQMPLAFLIRENMHTHTYRHTSDPLLWQPSWLNVLNSYYELGATCFGCFFERRDFLNYYFCRSIFLRMFFFFLLKFYPSICVKTDIFCWVSNVIR